MVSPAQRKIKRWLNQPEGDYGSRMDFQKGWCPRPDSNRHGLPHTPLKRARLPIPPLGLKEPGNCEARPGEGPWARLDYGNYCGFAGAGAGAAGTVLTGVVVGAILIGTPLA